MTSTGWIETATALGVNLRLAPCLPVHGRGDRSNEGVRDAADRSRTLSALRRRDREESAICVGYHRALTLVAISSAILTAESPGFALHVLMSMMTLFRNT